MRRNLLLTLSMVMVAVSVSGIFLGQKQAIEQPNNLLTNSTQVQKCIFIDNASEYSEYEFRLSGNNANERMDVVIGEVPSCSLPSDGDAGLYAVHNTQVEAYPLSQDALRDGNYWWTDASNMKAVAYSDISIFLKSMRIVNSDIAKVTWAVHIDGIIDGSQTTSARLNARLTRVIYEDRNGDEVPIEATLVSDQIVL